MIKIRVRFRGRVTQGCVIVGYVRVRVIIRIMVNVSVRLRSSFRVLELVIVLG
jgi:hypothetical protein